uniref:DDE Tnp4 domain-containing protein n=1 Tax=Eptatretus burgeri TaxID=7764 RepID=A0A8C4Q618_EPTBU
MKSWCSVIFLISASFCPNSLDLLCKLEPTLCCKIQPAGKKILCFLWLMGNRESFRSVADRFGISKSSLHRNLTHVANSLLILSKEEIQWPKETFEKKAISKEFEKFPGVVGCVDGTYIPMTGKSGAKRDLYICRKGFPAMHAQVVCDGNLKILDIITGYPGSVNDASVFQNSALYQALQSLPMQYHLLGDSAYTLEHFLMTPYKDNGSLSDTQKMYNFMHSSVRCCVERCIGLLKGKFRRLKNYECRGDELMCKTIIGCATLHNFILKREEVDEADIDLSDVESEKVDLSFVYSAAPNSRASKKRDDLSKKLI